MCWQVNWNLTHSTVEISSILLCVTGNWNLLKSHAFYCVTSKLKSHVFCCVTGKLKSHAFYCVIGYCVLKIYYFSTGKLKLLSNLLLCWRCRWLAEHSDMSFNFPCPYLKCHLSSANRMTQSWCRRPSPFCPKLRIEQKPASQRQPLAYLPGT